MHSLATVGRHSRALQILARLQAGEGVTVTQLAEEANVCRRTVFRDLNLLREAGLSVQFDEQGRCYRLVCTADVTVTPVLEAEELTTLLTAVQLSLLRPLPPFAARLEAATGKLLAGCSPSLRHAVTRVTTACGVRMAEDTDADRTVGIVRCVLQGIRQRRTLRVTLEPSGEKRVRTLFSPYQMIATSDAWEVVGRSRVHRAVRAFNARHFLQAELTDQSYSIPRQFNRRA